MPWLIACFFLDFRLSCGATIGLLMRSEKSKRLSV
jgi:hypothetical protein